MDELEAIKPRLDSTAWLGVGVVGLALFLLGIYQPALAHVAYGSAIGIALAIAGGALAVLGFSYWYDQRETERKGHGRERPLRGRAKELAIAPSLEVYRPGTVARPPISGESASDPDEPE